MSSEEKREICVDDYQSLKTTIDQFDKTKRIFILFSGSKDSNGISWCPDCVTAEKPLEEALKSSFPSNGILIQCPVGSKENWKNPTNSFRVDPQIRLTNIPTLIEWGTPNRLVETELFDSKMISILFEEN